MVELVEEEEIECECDMVVDEKIVEVCDGFFCIWVFVVGVQLWFDEVEWVVWVECECNVDFDCVLCEVQFLLCESEGKLQDIFVQQVMVQCELNCIEKDCVQCVEQVEVVLVDVMEDNLQVVLEFWQEKEKVLVFCCDVLEVVINVLCSLEEQCMWIEQGLELLCVCIGDLKLKEQVVVFNIEQFVQQLFDVGVDEEVLQQELINNGSNFWLVSLQGEIIWFGNVIGEFGVVNLVVLEEFDMVIECKGYFDMQVVDLIEVMEMLENVICWIDCEMCDLL